MSQSQIPQRPYLYRALHEWMTDSGYTPHIVVDANNEQTYVPAEFVEDGRIVLNISYAATHGLVLGNDEIAFQARFGGKPVNLSIPVEAVLGIYARETGEGMIFADDADADADENEAIDPDVGNDDEGGEDDPPDRSDRPHLRVVK
ncbi:MAG: ClpXP protease specificity-enhancing factor [Gammaproteobacteria bacterium]|nr:ClpXP protease specificity-enhancing factor [Gammaproteobacteria bacterium]MBT8445135.1 ClpXP protease specificity-enhancing factor [Gammaproteobacteria bacterium]NND35704.1 ClpXP protease specificity-enhancing factor [Gammaproteobacteria bacterium]